MSEARHTIDYAPIRPRWSIWKWLGQHRRAITIWALAIALVIVATMLPLQEHIGLVCATCGSRRGSQSLAGVTVGSFDEPSALHSWILKHQRDHAHDWRLIQHTSQNLLGFGQGRGHGRAPAAIHLKLMPDFVRLGTYEEIDKLVWTLKNGSPAQQEQAIDGAFDLTIRRLDEEQRGRPAK